MTPYYDRDGITIYHGDCREVLPTLGRFDLVLTDPPYGIAHKSNGQIFLDAKPIQNDHSIEIAEWLRLEVQGIPLAMFFSPYRPFGEWRNVLVWDKGEHVGIGGDRETCWKRDFEMIGVSDNRPLNGKRDSGILRCLAVKSKAHFAEEPIPLLKRLIFKLGGDTVLDPFMGSGTTLRAAKDLGRKATGIELEEKYCEIAAKRLEQQVFDFS